VRWFTPPRSPRRRVIAPRALQRFLEPLVWEPRAVLKLCSYGSCIGDPSRCEAVRDTVRQAHDLRRSFGRPRSFTSKAHASAAIPPTSKRHPVMQNNSTSGMTPALPDASRRFHPMNSIESPVAFEICPACSQSTASSFFRNVGAIRMCALCAQRAGKEVQAREARALDARYHGGLGWLWRHIGWVAFSTFAVIAIRILLRSLSHQ
jgi:hypothetical protein